MPTKFFTAVAAAAVTLFTSSLALAQTFPEPGKRITVIVPYAPGGGVDFAARLMAQDMSTDLGVPVTVENVPGAGAIVGIQKLLNSPKDGYTLSYAVFPTIITHYMEPGKTPPYTRTSFQSIGQHFSSPYGISVPVKSKYNTLKDLVEAARVKAEAVSISDSGAMASPHLTYAMLGQAAGVKFLAVHYNGGAPSLLAALQGEVDAFAGGGSDMVPPQKDGTMRTLGFASEKREALLPDVPTMREQGYDVLNSSLAGIIAPAGVPKAAVDRLTASMKKATLQKDHIDKMVSRGNEPAYMNPVEMDKFWQDFEKRLAPILPPLYAAQK